MRGPRGSLSALYEDASKIAEARLALVGQYLDDIAQTNEPSSGGVLTNAQFLQLLMNDPEFQEQLAEKSAFMTPAERKKLAAQVDELFPPELPETVTAIPPNPWER